MSVDTEEKHLVEFKMTSEYFNESKFEIFCAHFQRIEERDSTSWRK